MGHCVNLLIHEKRIPFDWIESWVTLRIATGGMSVYPDNVTKGVQEEGEIMLILLMALQSFQSHVSCL
jgi:hypothetical protein